MDIQLKRGLLDACVLAALRREESYGYKIIKDVSSCLEISESTLYPILRRMEASGFVSSYSVEHNSRLRKYYKITQEGEEKIASFIEEWKEIMAVYDFVSRGGQHEEK